MFKQCKKCHANMPEEANICLECLTLYEEKQTEKSTISQSRNSKKSTWLYAPVWAIITLLVCMSVSGLNTKLGEIKPAITESPEYYENEESTDNSAGNNNIPTNNNSNHSNYSNNTIYTTQHTQQNSASQNNTNNNTTANKPSKTLSTSSSIFSNIKVNPVTKPASTSASSSGNTSTANTSSANNLSGNTSSGNSSSANNNTANDNKNNNTTNKPVSNDTTNNNTNTTSPAATALEYDKFEHYMDSDGKLHISKYTGSSKNVIIPDKFNNTNVYRIDAGTFKDNSSIETITFKDSTSYHTLWIQSYAIENCSSLRKITFPKNTDLGILNQFARNCQKLSTIDIDNWQYEFINGGLYYWNTNMWSLYYYCEGYPSEEFRPATFFRATLQASLFEYCRNTKRIYLNDATTLSGFYSTSTSNKFIEGVYVDPSNKKQFDVDGVVFNYPSSSSSCITLNYYPQNKKDKAFKIPENARFDDIYNNYLEDLTIPKTATFYSENDIKTLCMKTKTKNLKTIRVQKGSPYTEIIKGTFTGTVIEY